MEKKSKRSLPGQKRVRKYVQVVPNQTAYRRLEKQGKLPKQLRSELLATDPVTLLRRLFAGETLRLFDPQPLRFACGCSLERSQAMLRGLGQAEVEDALRELGSIEVRCEFCNARYLFDRHDVAALFGGEVLH